MKILAFSDVHGNEKAIKRLLEKIENVDILICAGDISAWGNELEKLIAKFNFKTFLLVHGNHESEELMKKICSKFKFVHYIHKVSYRHDCFVFLGYGGGGFSPVDSVFENLAEKFKKELKKDDKVILVTHAPPYGTKLDILPHLGHKGSSSIRKFIEEFKPILNICGHFHENVAKKDEIGETVVINPGPEGKILRI